MKSFKIRSSLLSGASFGLAGMLALAAPNEASASTVCSPGAGSTLQTFDCIDDSTAPLATAGGTFSAGATLIADGSSPLEIASAMELDVTLNGQINAPHGSAGFITEGVSLSSAGPLSYQSNGTVTGTTDGVFYATYLHSDQSVMASTGTIAANGVRVTGVFSEAMNGDISLAGGNTTVSGFLSRGLWSYSVNGHNFTDTGTVTATGEWSRAVLASSVPTQGFCSAPSNDLSVTVNATAHVTAEFVAITTLTCGNSSINVEAGNTVAVTGGNGQAIRAIALMSANTNIDGSVHAATAGNLALDVRDAVSSNTVIGASGLMRGTFDGEEGADSISVIAGGVWESAGLSNFWGGSDQVTNAGTIIVSGNANFSGLELLTNSGSIDLANGPIGDALLIDGAYVGAAGASLHIDATDMGADRLTIGGHASGTTSLIVTTSVLIPDPLLVVDTDSSDPDAFVLGSTSATPLIDLSLTQAGDDYFLTAVPSAAAQQTVQIAESSLRRWQQSADDLLAGSALKRPARNRDRRTPFAFWARSSGGNPGLMSNRLTAGSGIQAGIDYLLADDVAIGMVGGYDDRKATVSAKVHGFQSGGSNFGAYVQYGRGSGFYAGVLAMADRRDTRLTHSAFVGADGNPNAKTIGVEAHVGFRTTAMGIGIDADGGLAYARSEVGDFAVDEMEFDFGNAKSLRGRLGLRSEFGGRLGIYADARFYYEIDGRNALTVSTGAQSFAIESASRTMWARFEAGFGDQSEVGPALSTWVELGAGRGLGMKAAMRF